MEVLVCDRSISCRSKTDARQPLHMIQTDPLKWGAFAVDFLFNELLAGSETLDKLDDESSVCFMGVVTALFLVAHAKLEIDGAVDGSAYFFKTLDQYISSMHPDRLDEVSGNGTFWPVRDVEVGTLRRAIMRASANTTKGTAIKQGSGRVPGNAFQVLPEDEVEPGITLASSMKVYVYDVLDYPDLRVLARGASFCRDNQWGFEVMLHDWFLACPCRTDDPREADFFFVPHYTACHLNVETYTEEQSQRHFESLVQQLKFFNRTGGHDHLFVWGSGMGADGPFRSWRQHIPNSIFLMTETELWNPYSDIVDPSYVPWKDIVLPGRLALQDIYSSAMASGTPPDQRRFLAEFVGWWRPLHAGQAPGESPRKSILRWASAEGGEKDRRELESEELFIKQDVPYIEALKGSTSSRFCLVPRGKSAWSSRFFRALFAGCVLVLLNDDYEPPFEAFLDVPQWLIKWPMRRVDDGLLEYLRSVPSKTLEGMLKRADKDRCWYVYPPSAIDYEQTDLQKGKLNDICPEWRTQNAFFGIMRLLQKKRKRSKTSFNTFYLPLGKKGKITYVSKDLLTVV
eukprot:TRINITY_DN18551_c0_g1_i4.p1 TRINITY_DN18551_c0_g1~~TRINITY_DN18551_c0_g1_i4.p1  ORF type:complete len:570 (+),score=73.56 TRINITY_DN18551_c0_g1_i4:298-2007(+)